MKRLFLAMPGNAATASALAGTLDGEAAAPEMRHFPDGETYLRLTGDVADRAVFIVATLDRPDAKLLPLLFAADAVHELGAKNVCLVAPYLAYMRQDRRFQPGEAVTSRSFARVLSHHVDGLVTVDPHLHRYKSLDAIYAVPALALQAAPLLADWIGRNVARPVLVGPDAESAQWVGAAAARIGAPFTVLEKTRRGDRDVSVRLTDANAFGNRTPVLVDDIVSSGETMLQGARAVRQATAVPPVCVAVHGLFADGVDRFFAREGLRIVTANTVAHASNAIDVSQLLADGIVALENRLRNSG